jgi:phosphoribosylglycinamide formyltransferase-1
VSRRIAVLVSGRGSNLQSIIDATRDGRLDAVIAVVISNRENATALNRAKDAGIETACLLPSSYPDRESFDLAIVELLRARNVELVCLAGYMQPVRRPMLDAFPNRILNIHPSLLPAFPGLHAQQQALVHGVKLAGATVHIVTAQIDGGPILAQAAVPVLSGDTVETLSARILVEEHRIYPETIARVLAGN